MKPFTLILGIALLALAQTGQRSGIDRSTIDTSCKPCDDFWRYADGAFMDHNPIPAQYGRWGTFQMLRDSSQERLKVLLESAAAHPASADEKRIGDFYAACLDTRSIAASGTKTLEPPIKRVAAIAARRDLAAVLVSLEEGGNVGPLRTAAQPDRTNSKQVIASVQPAGLSLPDREYYTAVDARSKEIRAEFVKHVAALMQLAGDSPAAASDAANAVLGFETKLAEARLAIADRRDPSRTFNKMDLAKLREMAPAYDWNALAKALKIPAAIAINVTEPDYVKSVETQLTQAPLETWKTWLRWRIVNDRAQYLSQPFYDEWFRFRQTVLNGVQEKPPRSRMCLTEIDDRFPDALGRLYIAKYFPSEAKRRMTQLVENLRAALRKQLDSAEWLEPDTRRNAIHKLDSFDPQIGYPSKWRDYAKVKVARGDFLGSLESSTVENRRVVLATIGHEVDRTQWGMTAPTVNAQYSSARNSITFPAGILQPPFFQMDSDDAANYGAIGAVIGHEMGHGFDDQGSKFDAEGNLKNWWTDADRKKFESRAGCVTSQFDAIDTGGPIRHNGKLVTGEAMGDLGGLTLAYRAYHLSLEGKEAPVLDGFTGDQRFFLAFARVWADQMRPEQERLRLTTDPHPLPKFRANATLANMPEFQEAFACKRGDAMVRPPEERCKLW